jgi:hypothetical protein
MQKPQIISISLARKFEVLLLKSTKGDSALYESEQGAVPFLQLKTSHLEFITGGWFFLG